MLSREELIERYPNMKGVGFKYEEWRDKGMKKSYNPSSPDFENKSTTFREIPLPDSWNKAQDEYQNRIKIFKSMVCSNFQNNVLNILNNSKIFPCISPEELSEEGNRLMKKIYRELNIGSYDLPDDKKEKIVAKSIGVCLANKLYK
ncbi:MAG: hypothetical protein OQK82_01095 [Candidatus Pacearchaeota archaeon]|nr:hypothetical protein [Candidatus Pacearchaeota archaeon]